MPASEMDTWQGILYGDAGVGKSDMFSSIAAPERPLVVALFDARAKAAPYYNPRRFPGRVLQPDQLTDKWGTPYQLVVNEKGETLLRLEYYHDTNFANPESAQRFLDRVVRLQKERDKGQFWGFILDSATAASMKYRKFHQYIQNPDAKNTMQWFGGETDEMENIVMQQLPQLHAFVGMTMHVSKTKVEAEGTMLRAPLIRGRNFEQLATQWAEIYRVHVTTDDSGKKVRRLQTENDEKWLATSAMGMPDGTKASWAAMVKALS